ncbi:MAG: sugar ABC transporter ATP-binding protein, partial [Calditrichales bacterium]
LLGENGAGKSTLVKILSGAYRKTEGSIYFSGTETDIKGPRHAENLGISIIYQELNLVPHLSVAENIFLGREFIKICGIIDTKRQIVASAKILADLGVQINARELVSDLGIAQQQMVEVAKALSLDAKIIIMDEPTSALTEKEIKELFHTIRQLKKRDVSIIYISHRLEELFEIGDRVTVLRDGKQVTTKPIAGLDRAELIRLMVNRQLKDQYPHRKAEIGEEVLRVGNLSTKTMLKNISLSLHRGEILGVAGLLGSGRTELARAIFGADPLTSGIIHVNKNPEHLRSPQDAIRLRIGYLTEDRKKQGLILNLSVKDNICLPNLKRFTRFGVVNKKRELQAVDRFIMDLNIRTPHSFQRVAFLSGGNQQKVVISKWLCSQADILIFDEPTRGIDVGAKREIYELMNDLCARGAAVLMISSDLPEILGMSDRIIVMHEGALVDEFPVAEATQEKILNRALGAA